MSAITNVRIICDSTIACTAKVEGGEQPGGSWVFPRTVTEARRLAKARGWFHVRWAATRRVVFTWDYCPACEDQAQAKADELGVQVTRRKAEKEPAPAPEPQED